MATHERLTLEEIQALPDPPRGPLTTGERLQLLQVTVEEVGRKIVGALRRLTRAIRAASGRGRWRRVRPPG